MRQFAIGDMLFLRATCIAGRRLGQPSLCESAFAKSDWGFMLFCGLGGRCSFVGLERWRNYDSFLGVIFVVVCDELRVATVRIVGAVVNRIILQALWDHPGKSLCDDCVEICEQ